MELIIIVVLSLVLVPLALLTSGVARIILGLLFVLFFPGYTLIAALFPRKGSLSGVERLALSLGLSIAVVPLIGLVLNYAPWGITACSFLFSILGFVVIMAAIALYRRRRLPSEVRFEPDLKIRPPALSWRKRSRMDWAITGLLAIAVAGAIGVLIWTVATPKVGEAFTEFYILEAEETAGRYPQELTLGEEGVVTLGIVNHEYQDVDYWVVVSINEEEIQDIGLINLEHGEIWEQEVSFQPTRAGLGQKVEFLLYIGEGAEPYRTLHLCVDVAAP